jgi:NMD protein affecting ribosome stability and mRNA decay
MRSTKRYTNATFTKRVDHDGGRHRPARAPTEPRLCTRCGAVYTRRRWVAAADVLAAQLRERGDLIETRCPACRIAEDGTPRGYLRIEGLFYATHQQDVERLVEAEAVRAGTKNPLGRIIEWDRTEPGVLTLATTTEHVVQRLAHALQKAFHGTVEGGFSHENKMARMRWARD